jgi:AcrR family transcriptional regulator
MKPGMRNAGRPRSAEADAAVTESTRSLLEETGYARLAIETVAARAGVAKTTIYRRWHSKAGLVFAVLFHPESAPLPDTGTLRGDLRDVIGALAARFEIPYVRAATLGLLADLSSDQAAGDRFDQLFVASMHEQLTRILERAAGRRELSGPVDPAFAQSQVVGPVFTWAVILRRPLSPWVLEAMADSAVAAIAVGGAKAVPRRR